MSKIKLAVLDLYNGIPNQGMRCIEDILNNFADIIEHEVFDVRADGKIPSVDDFDIFISSGGPGDPIEDDGHWQTSYYEWLDAVWNNNQNAVNKKKYALFICYSFQMAVHHFGLAKIGQRRSISFGTFPVHPTQEGSNDVIFSGLDNPFYVADFRRFQITQPNQEQLIKTGATVLALEKIRPHIDLERAIMAIRWSPEIIGTQFHPEADADGMLNHFSRPEIKLEVIRDHGRNKWLKIMDDLNDADKIRMTNSQIIPSFLRTSVEAILNLEPLLEGQ